MFGAIQYLVSSKKLEDGFGMDNVTMVNGRRKITRSCDDNYETRSSGYPY